MKTCKLYFALLLLLPAVAFADSASKLEKQIKKSKGQKYSDVVKNLASGASSELEFRLSDDTQSSFLRSMTKDQNNIYILVSSDGNVLDGIVIPVEDRTKPTRCLVDKESPAAGKSAVVVASFRNQIEEQSHLERIWEITSKNEIKKSDTKDWYCNSYLTSKANESMTPKPAVAVTATTIAPGQTTATVTPTAAPVASVPATATAPAATTPAPATVVAPAQTPTAVGNAPKTVAPATK